MLGQTVCDDGRSIAVVVSRTAIQCVKSRSPQGIREDAVAPTCIAISAKLPAGRALVIGMTDIRSRSGDFDRLGLGAGDFDRFL